MIILFFALFISDVIARIDRIIPNLIRIEAKGIRDIGDGGRAVGILQIHTCAIQDVNKKYKLRFTPRDRYDSILSVQIARLYLIMGAELYIKRHNSTPSEKDIVRMYNGGIYNGYNNPKTLKYWEKYKKIK